MSAAAPSSPLLLHGLGPSVATGLGLGLVLPLAGARGNDAYAPLPSADALATRAMEVGAATTAAELAATTGRAVATLWPHPPARFSTFALPDWAVAIVTPNLPAIDDSASFLGKQLIGKAAATFAARAVATTEALREDRLDLLAFALDDGSLADLIGASLPGLQPALAAARATGLPVGISRFRGRRCVAVFHPDKTLTATAATAAAERFAAHALSCEVTLTRFARCQPELLP